MNGYTKDEIILLYRQARDKVEQIRILADLTESDTETIMEILNDAGEYQGNYKICSKCGQAYPVMFKNGRSNKCPECRNISNEIAKKEYRLKQNVAKIEDIIRQNAKLADEIRKMKEDFGE